MTDSTAGLGAMLLAAGGSSRLGQSKQLLEIEGRALVARQAERLLAMGFVCTVVVTGSGRQQVESALSGVPVTLVYNDRWQEGMGTSIAAGIAAMPERVRGAALVLCDQWRIGSADIQRLVEAWANEPTKAVTSQWDGQTGPPVVFPRALFGPLRRLGGDHGARKILRRYAGGVNRVVVENAAFDIDVPGDIPK